MKHGSSALHLRGRSVQLSVLSVMKLNRSVRRLDVRNVVEDHRRGKPAGSYRSIGSIPRFNAYRAASESSRTRDISIGFASWPDVQLIRHAHEFSD